MERARAMSMVSCRFCCEGDGNEYLVLCNGDVCQVGRLDAEVRHVNGAGCRSGYCVAHDFPLHVKDFFVSLAVQRQIAGQLKMNSLPIAVIRR